jgi:hypothetical protein
VPRPIKPIFRQLLAPVLIFDSQLCAHIQTSSCALENTLIYTQLVKFEAEGKFNSAIAKTVEEARKLVDVGFEYVCDINGAKLFRKRV